MERFTGRRKDTGLAAIRATQQVKDAKNSKEVHQMMIERLAEIEDILGSEYDLEDLKSVIELYKTNPVFDIEKISKERTLWFANPSLEYKKGTQVRHGWFKGLYACVGWSEKDEEWMSKYLFVPINEFHNTIFESKWEAVNALKEKGYSITRGINYMLKKSFNRKQKIVQ